MVPGLAGLPGKAEKVSVISLNRRFGIRKTENISLIPLRFGAVLYIVNGKKLAIENFK